MWVRKVLLQDVPRIGYELVGSADGVYHVVRRRPLGPSVSEDREQMGKELYGLSAKLSLIEVMRATMELPARVAIKYAYRSKFRLPISWAIAEGISPIIDNLAIWRLSTRRLLESEGRNP